MDFEHAFLQSNFFMLFQMMFMGSLLVPSIIGRIDLYGKVVRALASNVVSFGPVALLVYVLYQVSHLN
ncbi:MAG: hypothetical protein M0R70_02590 [Nitrospirae bacterium]|nr:hypothetical protein [Nitrospirota bacterium]